tara:strand:- start:1392 stop:1838 length:447 start_codon:yes stop_codon:yes gene_type:complete
MTKVHHDWAQRESQPVPYWPGQENPLVDALKKGIVTSSDFDSCGVLALKDKPERSPEPAKDPAPMPMLPYQKQRLEQRVPLGRLDTAAPTPPSAADPAIDLLCKELAALELENAALRSAHASLNTGLEIHQRLIVDFLDLYELEHPQP